MSIFQALLADGVPPAPPSFDVGHFGIGSSHANISTRQTALEPAAAGVDRPTSWSGWIIPSNQGTYQQRILGCGRTTTAGEQQYNINILSQDRSDAIYNQKLYMVINGNVGGTIFINIASSLRILKARATHFVVTYSGNESNTGLNIYLNGVLDPAPTRSGAGVYAGALDDSDNRFYLSRVDAIAQQRFGGDMRDICVWNAELNQAEVTELFNNGLPFDVSTASFYAAKITAYYKLWANLLCSNNAALHINTSTGVTFRNRPMASYYETYSFVNAIVGNTAYISFGSVVQGNKWFGRRGTNHVAGGDLVKVAINPEALTASAPVVVANETLDLRGGSAQAIDGKIMLFSSTWDEVISLNQFRYESTDGFTGLTFAAGVSMPVTEPRFVPYGKVIESYTAGEYFVPWYEVDSAGGGVYKINLYHRDLAGVWTTINVWTGTATEAYVEPCMAKINGGRYIILCRSDVLGDLHMFRSSDGDGLVWSATADPCGLATGRAMADMSIDPLGRVNLIFADRDTDQLVIHAANNPDDIWADATDWTGRSEVFSSYPTDSTGILGYPTIFQDGWYVTIAVSAEFSSTRADLYIAYGILGFGV